MWKAVRNKWQQYKYRFVPWLSLNLTNRSVRVVREKDSDKIISDEEVEIFLLNFLEYLDDNDDVKKRKPLSRAKQTHGTPTKLDPWTPQRKNTEEDNIQLHYSNLKHMNDFLKFVVDKKESTLPSGGIGVFVTKGNVPPKTVVAMYPGTIFMPGDPMFLPSLGNPFIFQCIDGLRIDGNNKNLSRYNYRMCGKRDRVGFIECCDTTWLTAFPVNPLAVGQYVNNKSKRMVSMPLLHECEWISIKLEFQANVAYQEFDVPIDFPIHLLKYIPNTIFQMTSDMVLKERVLRTVVLVSLREIKQGEELFSNYFTLVQ